MENENSTLHKRLSMTLKENNDYKNKNDSNDRNIIDSKRNYKCKHKKLINKINKQKKEIKVFKKICKKRKRTRNNRHKKSTTTDSHHKDVDIPKSNDERNMKNSQNITRKHTQKTTTTQKNDIKKRMIIVGDEYTRKLGIKLKQSLGEDSDICCHTHSNAPLNIIINKANNIIEQEENIILAVCYKSFNSNEVMNYQTYLHKMIEEARKKKIIIMFTNIPYRSDQKMSYLNKYIHKINNHLSSLAILDNSIYVCNISNNHINFDEYKNIISYNISNLYNNVKMFKNTISSNVNFPIITQNVIVK